MNDGFRLQRLAGRAWTGQLSSVLLCGALGLINGPLAAQEAKAALVGMLSCSSASCHGQPVDDAFRTGTARQEFSQWLESDPHATAAHTLNSTEFRRILALVSTGREDGPPSEDVYVRCAQCHDPQGLALGGKDVPTLLATPADAGTRGISCESCHGAAEKWLPDHYRREVTKEQLAALGMIDTDNVLVRARQCVACHVGDAARDMNHDMIAAGHPPLRFELSSYHDLIQRKHWSDVERIEKPHFKAQLWAAGQLATLESTAALLQSRAERAAAHDEGSKPAAMWPEFAEFDCLACHQRLRPSATGKPPAELTQAGKPRWQPWNAALAPRLVDGLPPGDLALATTPAEAIEQAAHWTAALHGHSLSQSLSSLADNSHTPFTAADILKLIEAPGAERPMWATACQELLAVKAAYLAWRDEQRKLMRPAGAFSLDPADDDPWSVAFRQELDDLTVALRFGSREFEWPAFDWDGLPLPARKSTPKYTSLPEIQEKIRELAGQLKRQVQNVDGDAR